ncbi:MAG: hypothetical protein IPP32_07215 [Bacteroidetes bacterium]|nr:hypothetical protein [Bacteroidota bacterium]
MEETNSISKRFLEPITSGLVGVTAVQFGKTKNALEISKAFFAEIKFVKEI